MKQKLAYFTEIKKECMYDEKKIKLNNLFQVFFEVGMTNKGNKQDFATLQTTINALRGQVEHFSSFIGFRIPPEFSIDNPYNNKFNENVCLTGYDDRVEKLLNLYQCFSTRLEQNELDEKELFALATELRRMHAKLSDLGLLIGLHTNKTHAA